MEEYIDNWRIHFVPVRERLGFEIVGSWINRDAYEFVWLVSHADPLGFAHAEAAYYASADRAAITWDPKPYIEVMDLRILDPVGSVA
jgi:hypothetical protein